MSDRIHAMFDFIERIPPTLATSSGVASGVVGFVVYLEKSTDLLGLISVFLSVLIGMSALFYWVVKNIIQWQRWRKDDIKRLSKEDES